MSVPCPFWAGVRSVSVFVSALEMETHLRKFLALETGRRTNVPASPKTPRGTPRAVCKLGCQPNFSVCHYTHAGLRTCPHWERWESTFPRSTARLWVVLARLRRWVISDEHRWVTFPKR